MKVAKFGGSSLANADQFKRVKQIVAADHTRCYIVPSAPGRRKADDFKITDVLYLCHEHVQKSVDFEGIFELIKSRFITLRDALALDYDIERELSAIEEELLGGATVDYAASRGEYLSGRLLADYLECEFIDPTELIVIKRNGKLDERGTYTQINNKLKAVERAVIPGFYGATARGKIKTFSRGGSDISGAVIARGIAADVYENWTDVSGFQMADPRIVGQSKGILEITYRELRELSYMGANVFHEEAIHPVLSKGIPIHIRNTNRPQDPGTTIVESRRLDQSNPITGISGKKNFTVINVEKTLMKKQRGFIINILAILDKYGVTFEHMPTGIDSLSLVISEEELADKLDDILDDIESSSEIENLTVYSDMALIAVVGAGMVNTKGVSKKVFSALADQNINVSMITQGSNELSIIIGVQNDDMHAAIRAIYLAFE